MKLKQANLIKKKRASLNFLSNYAFFLFSWSLALLFFLAMMKYGTWMSGEGEKIPFAEYQERFLKESTDSLLLILPALFGTVVFAVVLLLGEKGISLFFHGVGQKIPSLRAKKIFLFIGQRVEKTISLLPTVLSAIPLFITAIFLIRYARLDTLNSHNYLYGAICLASFNLSYFYRRSRQVIEERYAQTYIIYARSLGIKERSIFLNYILPGAMQDHLTILRELLPHLVIESIIIEYTFSYSALLRSAIQSIQYQNWHYFFIFFYAFVLFLTAFDLFLRWLESLFWDRS